MNGPQKLCYKSSEAVIGKKRNTKRRSYVTIETFDHNLNGILGLNIRQSHITNYNTSGEIGETVVRCLVLKLLGSNCSYTGWLRNKLLKREF